MPVACSKCGRENAGDASFCSSCGAALSVEPAAQDARKRVTVVFSDVAGSTSLGERLDPESLRGVMSRYYADVRAALEKHGGTVEKFIGDAVMAVFGAPTVHEDDAVRAVRATVEMKAAVEVIDAEVRERWGVGFEIRTGLNTGEVLVGDPSEGQSFVTADAVNVAARLEQSARPGEVLLGEETYRLVRDAVHAEPVEPLALKGKAEAVTAFRLLGLVPGASGVKRRFDSPLVGRSLELTELKVAFEHTVAERSCHLVTVMAPAGLGKSRLTSELIAQLGEQAKVLQGHCLSYGEGITFWPLAEVVRQAAGITGDESSEEAKARILHLLPEGEFAQAIARRVGETLGLWKTVSRPEEIFWAMRSVLEALARDRPVLLVFDDIHWAEATLLDFIEYLAGFSQGVPILVLCLARPELLELRPEWMAANGKARTITLGSLTAEESEALIQGLLGQAELADEISRRISRTAGGNPLFVEELMRMLVDEGLLQSEHGEWKTTADVSGIAVPPTVQALIAARVDRLPAPERVLVERASVIGEVFWWGAVAELSPEPARAQVGGHLQALVRKELVHPEPTTFAAEDAFRFAHILIRDVAYAGVLKSARAELHETFAAWLERKLEDRIGEYEEILAYHLEQAYRYTEELGSPDEHARALAAAASGHLASTGNRAFCRGDMPAAINLLERAIALMSREDVSRVQLMLRLGIALRNAGAFARADTVLSETIEDASASGQRGIELQALVERGFVRVFTDPESGAAEVVQIPERVLPVFEELGDDLGMSRAWLLYSGRHWFTGQLGAATEAMERALAHAQKAEDERTAAEIFEWLIMSRFWGPATAQEAISRSEQFVEWTGGDRSAEAGLLILRGGFEAMAGDFAAARELCDRGKAVWEDLGLTLLLATASLIPASVELLADNPAGAERELRPAYETLVRIGDRAWLPGAAAMLADALYRMEQYDEAEHFIAASEDSAPGGSDPGQVWRQAIKARLLIRRQALEEAETRAREAVRVSEGIDQLNIKADASMALAEVLIEVGRASEAALEIDKARSLYAAKGNLVSEGRAVTALERLEGRVT
jgi:class 3 adenylate cyclase/tetratricopeptide (TPR) repeat protein